MNKFKNGSDENIYLDESRLVDHENYLRVEPETFNLSAALLKKLGFRINKDRAETKNWFNTENLIWKVEEPFISNRSGHFCGLTVAHQAIHSLIALRFGWERENRPLMTLLN